MNTQGRVVGALLLMFCAAMMTTAAEAAKKNKGGLLGNSYASKFEQITDTSIRITSRKKVTGTLDEVNTPGTSTYEAFEQIKTATIVRAAVEAKNLGYSILKASGSRNLSKTTSKRSSSGLDGLGTSYDSDGTASNTCPGGICESDFTFTQGHYMTDVELAIAVTFDMLNELPNDEEVYINVEAVLQQYGLN